MTTTDGAERPMDWGSPRARANRQRRYGADLRLRFYGLTAIVVAVGMLAILLGTLAIGGSKAFVQTHIALDFTFDASLIPADDIRAGRYRQIVTNALTGYFPDLSTEDRRAATALLSADTQNILRDAVLADPSLIGQTVRLSVPATDRIDQFNKGIFSRTAPEEERPVTDRQIALFDVLAADGRVATPFNWGLLFNVDSRHAEVAGLRGAITGTFYMMLVTFVISFPLGIGAAVYLEEFARRNRWTAFIEVNINNLAAVPSVVMGLLGLAVFINFLGMPRSAPLVGGLVLALITLPTMIIVTRASLKAVPPSIREAAYGVGASKHQMVLHHVLPLALPGILTGTIISLARAIGESAPLLLVGMNVFLADNPGGLLDAATTLPTQIYLWADSPERGFIARTSAAILVLLAFLILMNALAIFLRRRLERTW